jgi:ADP-dependent NAD(P)H-hydrate dehydratase / NAD(P)H-hydrate epimerase
MKIVTAAEMREIDRLSTVKFGVPSLTLMENAGTAVADFVISQYSSARSIAVVCGKGNNGGDGFVVARKLHESGKHVQVLLLADPTELRGDADMMFAKIPNAVTITIARSADEIRQTSVQSIFGADILIDAILGTGFKPPVSELYAEAIALLNAREKTVVAVDIPSGAEADRTDKQTGIIARADAVVTFTAPKPALVFGQLTSGPLVVAPIGTPEEAIVSSQKMNLTMPRDIASLIGPRPADSNKGNFGHVLVVGGSSGKAGSVAMAGMAALRSGAGLATVATASAVQQMVAGFHPELMTEALPQTHEGSISSAALKNVMSLSEGMSVLALGPGISRNDETSDFVRALVKQCKIPMVLDADGLNAFEGRSAELSGTGKTLVITPHPGEMARLIGGTVAEVQNDRIKCARKFARDHDLIVVLKGHRTLIAHPDGTLWVNTTGNPGMATGGTGDILTGMVSGLLAQNPKRPLEAVLTAVYLHGLAGDVACETMGEHSLVATDLLKGLPGAFRRTQLAGAPNSVEISF